MGCGYGSASRSVIYADALKECKSEETKGSSTNLIAKRADYESAFVNTKVNSPPVEGNHECNI